MQRRHTDPLHQQTPVGNVLAGPHLPNSVVLLVMAKQFGQCHLHRGRTWNSVLNVLGRILEDISESQGSIVATWISSCGSLKVGLECYISIVLQLYSKSFLVNRPIRRRNLASAHYSRGLGHCEKAWAHWRIWIKHVTHGFLLISVSFSANTMGPCLVWLWCCGTWWAGLSQRRHRRSPRQLQPIMVEGTSAWGTGSLPCQLRHTGATVRLHLCPRGSYQSCLSDMTGTEKECIFPCPQDIWWFWFCLNLLAIDLSRRW